MRYSKTGRVRYVSARDLTSVWERALRREGLPIAWSQGFRPHPKVSFPDALPVGWDSTGEYAELTFTEDLEVERDLTRLSHALPAGMGILRWLVVPDGAIKLAAMLTHTLWEIELDPTSGSRDLPARIETLLARTSAEVTRHRPSGDRILDVRPAVVALRSSDGPTPRLRAVFSNDGPTIRPSDLMVALDPDDDLSVLRYRRVAQGAGSVDGVVEALSGELLPVDTAAVAEAA
ncbi:MAG: TIGR03936 family radical SAM-associated protein [Nitriliruptorales bacterium]|nr:TIGR03936 family radical SAM-associated protein [Nitriliruptorales bacterium]